MPSININMHELSKMDELSMYDFLSFLGVGFGTFRLGPFEVSLKW